METLLVGEQEEGSVCSRLCFKSECGDCCKSVFTFLTNSCKQILVFFGLYST